MNQWQQLFATCPTRLLGLSAWLMMMMALMVPLERRWPLHAQATFRRGFADDLAYFFLGGIVPAFIVVAFASLAQWMHRHGPDGFYVWLGALPFTLRVMLTLVIGEIVYYWAHRWSHEVPFLWRFHAIHHSPDTLDWLVNTRAHPLDLAFSRSLVAVVLILLGLAEGASGDLAAVLALVIIFNTSWGFFIHSNLRVRLGPLEQMITTPAFHHWHHSKDGEEYANKNYAALFPWIDRLFGTYYLPEARYPRRYGIDMPMPADLSGQLLLPLRPGATERSSFERPCAK
ncbi:MAG TPA: sterol desaturase family protein [Gammaproteobacteria bacterium]|nr:sterol desaturase family protein [Gammaproteobacteria bacterium]